MPAPAVTYTFSNGTTADGSQVTQNFTDVINALTDGLQDLTIGSLTLTTDLTVANGGTGLSAGTSGGIPYFSSTSTIASSALLAANQVMLGGGAGATPYTLTNGTAGQYLRSAGGTSAPTYGTITTEWASYTPSTNGLGTIATVETFWRQVGDSIEMTGNLTCGTPTAAEARIGLPNSYTSASTSKISSIRTCGWNISNTVDGGSGISTFFSLIEPSVTYITIGARYGTGAPLTKLDGSTAFAAGNVVTFYAIVPISGLTA